MFLPVMAAIGFMFGVASGEHSLASVCGALVFTALGFGIFLGMFRMARVWEGPVDEKH